MAQYLYTLHKQYASTVRDYTIQYCTVQVLLTVAPGEQEHSSLYTPHSITITVMDVWWLNPYSSMRIYSAWGLRYIQEDDTLTLQ
jgi:hypothetical protein